MTTTTGPADATMLNGGAGVRLGKYVLEAPLGAGGMAEVFRAHTRGAEGFQRPVAIKRILPDASRNPAFSEMFIAEAKLCSRLQHPNIVSVLDFDRDHEGRLYLVMELVAGRDLDGLLESGRLPFSTLIYVTIEVLRGLGYAHDLPIGDDGVRGLIHRDISPHNVLLSWMGAVKVSDFGIAKARAATAASASVSIKGKPAYMSPEQINGSALDGRSDLFAVGVMMWQMLTGQHLFAQGNTAETLARVLFAPVPPPSGVVAGVPPDLEAVTMRMLERDPARRYQTAEDAIDDLLRCQHTPRDGRRELEQLLLARFPQKAPVRTGQRPREPAPEASAPWPAGTPGPEGHGTVPLGPRALPATTAAPVNTAAGPVGASPGTTRRAGMVVAAVIGAVVVAVAAVIIATSGGRAAPVEVSGRDAAELAAALDAAASVGGSIVDAGVEDAAPLDAAVPVDGGARIEAPVDGRRRGSGARPGRADGGSATIHEIPLP